MNHTERKKQILAAASSIPIGRDGADVALVPDVVKAQLKELCGSACPKEWDNWNEYVCSWLLEDFYPGRQEAPLREERREAVLFYLDVLNELFLPLQQIEYEYYQLPNSSVLLSYS